MTDGDLVHAGRTVRAMTSTSAKVGGGWLANYYLRGGITLGAVVIAMVLGMSDGTPLVIGVAVWTLLWLASKVREGYAGTDRQP
jgi:hypothetical protein